MKRNLEEVVKAYEASTGTKATDNARRVLAYFLDNQNEPERIDRLLSALRA